MRSFFAKLGAGVGSIGGALFVFGKKAAEFFSWLGLPDQIGGAIVTIASTAPFYVGPTLLLIGFACVGFLIFDTWKDRWRVKSAAEPVAVSAAKKHIPLLDFIAEAGKFGWDITGVTNAHIIDLMVGIRQAAADGVVALRGRLDRDGTGMLSHFEIKTPIPCEHWANFEIVWWPGEPNWKIGTMNKMVGRYNCKYNRYLDLELERDTAIQWLRNESLNYRGWHEQKNERYNDGYI